MAQAPFPARPDTVIPGDLRGPFDGRVLDGDTGKPVEGAAVLGAWALEEGAGLRGPSEAPFSVVETDADGRYRLRRLPLPADPSVRVARFTVVVYKRGFVAWRSDRRFDDLAPRHDFAQLGAVVKLQRLPPDVSHAHHLAFAGAGGPLLSRMAWELPLAAAESAPAAEAAPMEKAEKKEPGEPVETKPSPPREPLLDVRALLSPDELKAVTGWKGSFTVEPLGDVPQTANYGSVVFRATGEPARGEPELRVFRVSAAEAEKEFERLKKSLPDAKEGKEVGDRSLRATEGDLLGVAMLDRAQGVVLVFTCGRGLCGDHRTLEALARRMATRFGRLVRPSTFAPPGKSEEQLPEGSEPPAPPAPPASPALPASPPPPASPAPLASPPSPSSPSSGVPQLQRPKPGRRHTKHRGHKR